MLWQAARAFPASNDLPRPMKSLLVVLKARPSLADISFFLSALIFRPWEVVGILRREAARIRNGSKTIVSDPTGVIGLVDLWEAEISGGRFEAPPRSGGPLVVEAIRAPTEIATALQHASEVRWSGVERAPAFPALSLEAARLGLRQSATNPPLASFFRSRWLLQAGVSAGLRKRLHDLSLRGFETR